MVPVCDAGGVADEDDVPVAVGVCGVETRTARDGVDPGVLARGSWNAEAVARAPQFLDVVVRALLAGPADADVRPAVGLREHPEVAEVAFEDDVGSMWCLGGGRDVGVEGDDVARIRVRPAAFNEGAG
jgi:hypothetical protein